MQAFAHDVAAEGVSTAGIELQSRGMSMSFLSQQVCSSITFQCVGFDHGRAMHQMLKIRQHPLQHQLSAF